jgi:hypothetical protein
MPKFKFISFIFLLLFLSRINVYAQQLAPEEIVAHCNEMIDNIYNDIWLIKNGYKELQNLGPQNIRHVTPELPPDYQAIKNIRIENLEVRTERRKFFLEERYNPYIQDEVYICFSDSKRVLGIGSDPLLCIYLKPYGLYLLFFSSSESEHLKKAITRILTRNARITVI